jgi:hypothetical protein
MRAVFFVTSFVVCASLTVAYDPPKPANPVKPVFTMSRETTYITEPLDDDGLPDYETALNRKIQGKILPSENVLVRLWDVLVPMPENHPPMHKLYWQWLGRTVPPENGSYFLSFRDFAKSKGLPEDDTEEADRRARLMETPWKAADHKTDAEWLKEMDRPLAIVTEAVTRKAYFNPIVSRTKDGKPATLLGALMPHLQQYRNLGDALCKRAMLRTSEGKYDEAWKDLITVHRLGRHVSHGSCLIELLVGLALEQMACRAEIALIEAMKPSANQVEAMFASFEELPPMNNVSDVVNVGERCIILDTTTHIRRHGIDFLEGLSATTEIEKKEPKINRILDTMNWDVTLKAINTWHDQMVRTLRIENRTARNISQKNWEILQKEMKTELIKLLPQWDRDLQNGNVSDSSSEVLAKIVLVLMTPAAQKVQNATERTEQTFQNTRLSLALAAHHADHKKYPAKLDDLVPKYLKKVPGDIFSGKSLVYSLTETGYLLYSVGQNEQDDGGKLIWDNPNNRGDDIGIRRPAMKK